jgi:hypothetical protein
LLDQRTLNAAQKGCAQRAIAIFTLLAEEMSKTLILHIGHYKTGTTALQVFFHQHLEFLSKAGVDYPDVWMHNSKHSAFAFSLLRAAGVGKLMYDYSDPTKPEKMWGDLFKAVLESEQPNVLISSEEFMRIGQFPRAREALQKILENRPEGIKVKAVAYLREPGAHLHSWYNQLIKMRFRVADINRAVNGDIEEIHYNYERALGPWIEMLGAENVSIRPYVKDPANPAALHEDFVEYLGTNLPPDLLKIEKDPNPRMDDRVVELVRLMQNMELGKNTINAVRKQALDYIDMQDRQIVRRGEGMTEARVRARQGLEWLETQSGSHINTEAFMQNLPQPASQQQVDQDLMLGFVFSEFLHLRQRINRSNFSALEKRIEELEQKLK